MPVYGAQGKAILDEHLSSGKPLNDVQLNNINLENFSLQNREINSLSCRRSILDNSHFLETNFYDTIFEESNLKDALFQQLNLDAVNFNSSVMLRAKFLKAAFWGGAFKRCYMQRIEFSQSSFKDTLFLNVEAAKSKLDQSVFVGCDFLFDDSGGITGFQESIFSECLFIQCSFQGYALSGVVMENCVFINSRFALPDWEDLEIQGIQFCACTGIPEWKRIPEPHQKTLDNEQEAIRLLEGLREIN